MVFTVIRLYNMNVVHQVDCWDRSRCSEVHNLVFTHWAPHRLYSIFLRIHKPLSHFIKTHSSQTSPPALLSQKRFQCLNRDLRMSLVQRKLEWEFSARSLKLSSVILSFCSLWHWQHWPNLLAVGPWGTLEFTGPLYRGGWHLWWDTNDSVCLRGKC